MFRVSRKDVDVWRDLQLYCRLFGLKRTNPQGADSLSAGQLQRNASWEEANKHWSREINRGAGEGDCSKYYSRE
jgi:hypothetical protein